MKRVRKKLHPIGRAIENVLSAGHTPRLQIDARRKDVVVPDHVRTRWGARLIIDLDPSWPLALEHTKDALEVDLAFHGIVDRCRLGWGAIYAIVDRATGQGSVFRENLPLETLPPELLAEGATSGPPPAETPPRVSLTAVRSPPEEARVTPVPSAAHTEPASPPGATGGAAAPAEPPRSTSDEEARARRARFRVIAGGG